MYMATKHMPSDVGSSSSSGDLSEATAADNFQLLCKAIAALTSSGSILPSDEHGWGRFAFLLGKVIAVEGVISAGKTVLLQLMEDHFKTKLRLPFVKFLENPNPEALKQFYEELDKGTKPNPVAYEFQLGMLYQRMKINSDAAAAAGRMLSNGVTGQRLTSVWTDRSLFGDAVFFAMHRANGNINARQEKQYLSILKANGPFYYDMLLFLDVSATRAHDLCTRHRKNKDELNIPREYFIDQRRAYYIEMREQALTENVRIAYFYNDPWVCPEEVLRCLQVAPTRRQTKEIFAAAQQLTWHSTEADIDAAYAVVRAKYEAIWATAPADTE